jgi:hypothetical protein
MDQTTSVPLRSAYKDPGNIDNDTAFKASTMANPTAMMRYIWSWAVVTRQHQHHDDDDCDRRIVL